MGLGRFTDAELENSNIDPHELSGLARCPWCGADILLAVSKSTHNLGLWHQGHADPTDLTGTRYVTGCGPYQEALRHDDAMKRLLAAGARFQKLIAEGPS